MSTLLDYALRLLSHFDHYGRCERCRISYKYREPQRVEYEDNGRYASPLCRRCFDEIDPMIARRYFRRLWVTKWDREQDQEAYEAWRRFFYNAVELKLERDGEIKTSDPMELRQWAP